MNVKPSWDTTPDMFLNGDDDHSTIPQEQQSPLDPVGHDADVSIIEALENQTGTLNISPLKDAMVTVFGGCPPEIRRSFIEDATQYGEATDNALYGLVVWDTFNEHLEHSGCIFSNPTAQNEQDVCFGHGGHFFNRDKLDQLPLLVTDDIALAFKTAYPVYQAKKITAVMLKALSEQCEKLYFVAALHEKDDIQRRFRDLDIPLLFLPEPPSIVMEQVELDREIAALIMANHSNAWGELLPLAQAEPQALRPYPIHALPPIAQAAVMAIAEHVQAPIAMTAQCVIGAMSHIAQSKVNAPNRFKESGEPCSLFLLTEGQSGSRKSTSRNMADKAILRHERKQYELYRKDMEQWKSGQASLNKKDREAYCVENPPPHDPSTMYSDITLESLAGLYVDGVLNNASIASDEAGQFFGGHTMKGDTRTQALGSFTKLFDDGHVERTRSKSNLNGSGRANDVRLTFNLQGQHEVLSAAMCDPILRNQGFLPRFLLSIPENLAGTRLQDAIYQQKNAQTDTRLIHYWQRCEYLLDECPLPQNDTELHNGRYVIQMDETAQEIDNEFYNVIEALQGKGQRYEYLQAFASRASQLSRRLATVFAYFQGLPCIDAKTLMGACEVVKHSLEEWASYAEVEAKTEGDAERLIKWIVKKCMEQKTDRLIYSNVQTSCPRPMQKNKNLLEMVIQQLIDFNHIKIESIGRTRYVIINPFYLNDD
ncbi:DUF3987 domain-containing protein [Acinetobacter sp. MD2]|uniref:DUF3987 domain-containing protein n=1 Tax=Acinetobacter sp. MD2 TaxID=2600066 RepID=UPI002D1F8858|nr:DUF3987 domain-containing protein [Acinetobacter sp. MD2]MEB3766378.1 DUF3987 domain-containing protein [Acinetobacter sp. MD2]